MLVIVNIEKIKNLRLKSGLTRHGLSIKAGLGKNAISRQYKSHFYKIKTLRLSGFIN